jgi:eukaryotic-like serine/threonine-protein kinase
MVLLRNEGGRPAMLQPQADVRDCAVSPDGRWVVARTHLPDETGILVKVWEVSTGDAVKQFPVSEVFTYGGFSPDGRWLTTSRNWRFTDESERSENFCRCWETGTWLEGKRIPSLGLQFWDLDITADTLSDGSIVLWQISSGRKLARLSTPENGRVVCSCLHRSGYLFANGKASGILYVWDLPLIRRQLAEMGLDWEGPPYFSEAEMKLARTPCSVHIDAGELAADTPRAEKKTR